MFSSPQLRRQLLRMWRGIKKLEGKYLLLPLAENLFAYETKWDVLILLDGCRWDTFKKINFLPGELSSKILYGTCTPGWASQTMVEPHPDLVYVSANPFVSHYYLEQWGLTKPFLHLAEVWDKGWDKKLKTVKAETVTAAALKMLRKFPGKKLFLHYMQPHHPFIGHTKVLDGGWSNQIGVAPRKSISTPQPNHVYELLKAGQITRAQAMRAYEDNLRYVLHNVQKFLTQLPPKTRVTITSDHGNCFGEMDIYGHPEKTFVRELLEVPWFTMVT